MRYKRQRGGQTDSLASPSKRTDLLDSAVDDKYAKRSSNVCYTVAYYVCIGIIALQLCLSFILYMEGNNLESDKSPITSPRHPDIIKSEFMTGSIADTQHKLDKEYHRQMQVQQQQQQQSIVARPDNYDKNGQKCRYAYMQLTDGSFDYLYGILSIHGALIRTKSPFEHHVMVMPDVPQQQIDLFHHLGIGTYKIDPSLMDPYLSDCKSCWTVTFYKMFIFNMTQFDKILYLDSDVGIMSGDGIDELLMDYPTPAGVCDRANPIELNGGVLLVSPNSDMFADMLKYLPLTRNSQKVDHFKTDPWNCEWRDFVGDQGFINAYFNNPETKYGPFYALHFRYGLLTSRFSNEWQRYFLEQRPHVLKNVHFTVAKPWHTDGLNMFRRAIMNMQRAKDKHAWYTDEMMARFYARYWLDVKIVLDACAEWCKMRFTTNQSFVIPDDLNKFLQIRPEPYQKGEIIVGYSPMVDTTVLPKHVSA